MNKLFKLLSLCQLSTDLLETKALYIRWGKLLCWDDHIIDIPLSDIMSDRKAEKTVWIWVLGINYTYDALIIWKFVHILMSIH